MIASVRAEGPDASAIESDALRRAAPLFRARLDHGEWFAWGRYTEKLAVIDCTDAHVADTGIWKARCRVGVRA